MSFNFEQSKNYNPIQIGSDLPGSIQSCPVVKPAVRANVRQVVAISQSGSQVNGGLVQVQLPSNQWMKAGSAYLRFTLAVTRATTGATLGFGGGPIGNISSLINRLTVQQGGNNLESILNYGVVEQAFLLNKTSPNFLAAESKSTEGSGVTGFGSTSSLTTNFEFCMPLISGLFNSQNDIPLGLLSSPLTVLFELQSNNNIIFVDTATTITSWSMGYQGICYTELNVDSAYNNAIKAALQQGSLYTIPSQTVTCQNLATTSSMNFLLSLSCNSLQSAHHLMITVPAAQTSGMPSTAQGQTINSWYLDGNLLNQIGTLDTTLYCAQVFKENRRGWNAIDDPTVSYALDPNGSGGYVVQNDSGCGYLNKAFCGGVSAQCFHESNLCFTGSPCSILRFEWVGSNSITANTNTYIIAIFDCLFSISADGQISKNI